MHHIGCRLTTLPLLKSSKSGTGMVVTPGGSWEGVKFTATGTTYHGIVLALKVPPVTMNHYVNKYSENAKYCKALVSMYINKFKGCQKLILFTFP